MQLPTIDELRTIASGIKIGFEDMLVLVHAIPVVKAGIADGKPVLQILKDEAPAALAVLESAASLAFGPMAGAGIQFLASVYGHSRPMTRDEEEAWMQRASRE